MSIPFVAYFVTQITFLIPIEVIISCLKLRAVAETGQTKHLFYFLADFAFKTIVQFKQIVLSSLNLNSSGSN